MIAFSAFAFSALMLLVACQERHPARKNLTDEVCWHGYLLERSANSLHMVQLMPLTLHHHCFNKIQNSFIILVPTHLGSPGQRVVKR